MGDFAGRGDRCLAVGPGAGIGAVGDPGADHEIELRGAPHAIRQAHLGKARQVELRRLDVGGAALPLDCQLDRQFGFGLEEQDGAGGHRLDAESEPPGKRPAFDAPAFGSLADRALGERLGLAGIFDPAAAGIDGDAIGFAKCPAAGFPGG
ncbi:MAG: hypothetical protein WKF52_03930 [Sphingomicrobium sp.]